MKKIFFLLVILLTAIFFSCSKEKTIIPKTKAIGEKFSTANSADRIGNWGSITGLILPSQKVISIRVYNDKFSTTEFYYMKDGNFRFDKIPPGIYTVTIAYIKTGQYPLTDSPDTNTGEMAEHVITDIKVGAGMIINLGVIKLL